MLQRSANPKIFLNRQKGNTEGIAVFKVKTAITYLFLSIQNCWLLCLHFT